jgi:hypothetical protein
MKISRMEAEARSRRQFIWYSIHFFSSIEFELPFSLFVRSSIHLIDCHGGPFTLNRNTICIPLVGGQCGDTERVDM